MKIKQKISLKYGDCTDKIFTEKLISSISHIESLILKGFAIGCDEGKYTISENNNENLKYKKLYTELSTIISKWWDKHEYDTIFAGEGEFDNLYDEVPDFVAFTRKNDDGRVPLIQRSHIIAERLIPNGGKLNKEKADAFLDLLQQDPILIEEEEEE